MAGTTTLSNMLTPIAPVDSLLAAYVTGGLPRPASVLVEAHLEMTEASRGWVRDLEVVAADAMQACEPAALSGRDAMLSAIFAADGAEEEAPAALRPDRPALPPKVRPGRLPRSIRGFIGRDLADVPWRTVLPGLREWKVGEADGCTASLIRIRPGVPVPHHTHGGAEVTLVLEGGFRDRTGHYVEGDIAAADDTVDHRPVADLGRDCICFAVTDAPLRLTGLVGRLVSRLSD